MSEAFRKLHEDVEGATATEYIIILVLVVAATVVLWKQFGKMISSKFQGARDKIEHNL